MPWGKQVAPGRSDARRVGRSRVRPACAPATRAWPTAAAAALAAVVIAACRDPDGPRFVAAGAARPRPGGIMRISVPDAVATLDPAFAYDEHSTAVLHLLHDTLLGYPPTSSHRDPTELVPQLAESVQVSGDGRLYSFVLRPDIVFSDGSPCVAADVKYALERILRLPTSPFQQWLFPIEGARELAEGKAATLRGLRIIDDRHFTIALVEPDASFRYILAMKFTSPQKRRHLESLSPAEQRRSPLGTGPFSLAAWHQGERLVLRRNRHYAAPDPPYLDGIDILEATPPEMAFLKFEAGELDTIAQPTPADYLYLARHPAWRPTLSLVPQMNVFGALLNCARPPFDDPRVRRAVNYAVNRERQLRVMNGRAVAAHGPLPPAMPGHDATLRPYPHDPARARQLLAEAGFPRGFAVTYVTFEEPSEDRRAQALQADLAAIGISMAIQKLSFPAYVAAVARPETLFAFVGWSMDYPDPSNFVDVNFHSRMIAGDRSSNLASYANPVLDALLDRARRDVDSEHRAALYREIDGLLHREAPWLWNFHLAYTEIRQPYVMNAEPHPIWSRDYRRTWLDVGPDGQPVRR